MIMQDFGGSAGQLREKEEFGGRAKFSRIFFGRGLGWAENRGCDIYHCCKISKRTSPQI
jgi:hypothetical protein